MGDEFDGKALLERVTQEMLRNMVDVMRLIYGGGYVNQKLTFEERRALRAKSYQVLKALGLER